MNKRVIEVLGFDGCPNIEPVIALVERLLAESAVDAEVRRVEVVDADAAARLRFLGSRRSALMAATSSRAPMIGPSTSSPAASITRMRG